MHAVDDLAFSIPQRGPWGLVESASLPTKSEDFGCRARARLSVV